MKLHRIRETYKLNNENLFLFPSVIYVLKARTTGRSRFTSLASHGENQTTCSSSTSFTEIIYRCTNLFLFWYVKTVIVAHVMQCTESVLFDNMAVTEHHHQYLLIVGDTVFVRNMKL